MKTILSLVCIIVFYWFLCYMGLFDWLAELPPVLQNTIAFVVLGVIVIFTCIFIWAAIKGKPVKIWFFEINKVSKDRTSAGGKNKTFGSNSPAGDGNTINY